LQPGKQNLNYTYTMRDNEIKIGQVEFAKDLGVLFDKKLNFFEHVDKIVAGASRLLGLIRRSIHSLNKQNFGVLFKTLVCPKLEYNNSLLSGILKQNVTASKLNLFNGELQKYSWVSKIYHTPIV